ncbi:hypothetical protein BTJ40_05815 [Microbulbifer sp. A4B17]|uniref:serine protease n=1 Tax=Microbulbifer sp. A4B17 TaxID=359370 RepID=UPI000D52B649|nr:serine protease [Microbulbifer sp. A4B17]AWF80364.1 hypothetical protein BTJ40_05815 [Microbulbifer sp. A4B17]
MIEVKASVSDIDIMVQKWGDILVPIYTEKPHHNGVAQLLGTGFIVQERSEFFLVTALHVVKEHAEELLIVNINSHSIPLNKMPFAISEEDDLAVSHLSIDWLSNNGIEKIKALPIDNNRTESESTGINFLIGFPGKKNIINPRLNKIKKYIQGTSFTAPVKNHQSKPHIRNPLVFHFSKKNSVDSDNKRVTPPSFSGNSGGPVLELVGIDSENELRFACRLSGIFVGWYEREKEIISIKSSTLRNFIHSKYWE